MVGGYESEGPLTETPQMVGLPESKRTPRRYPEFRKPPPGRILYPRPEALKLGHRDDSNLKGLFGLGLSLGCSPLAPTVLTRAYSTPYYNSF